MFLRYLVTAAVVTLAAGHCVRDYTVKDGDYCDKISAAQNVSTYQLAVINNGIINNGCTNLVPGQKICLGYENEDCTTVHVVAGNDTCDAIAAAHSVNTTLLYENNPQIDPECSNIYVGEVLCVASKVIIPPPVSGKPFPVPSNATLVPQPTTTPVPQPNTPVPQSTTPPSPQPSPKPTSQPDGDDGDDCDDGDDGDDEDLPWCDEV